MILQSPITLREVDARPTEWLPGCAYFECPESGVQFVNPVPAVSPVFPDFAAYGDELLTQLRTDRTPLAADTPPVERHALAWARRHLPPGAPVIELFSECGRFAWQLRDAGFEVRTADPLASHVAVLRRHGFPSEHSLCPDGTDGPPPAAIFILESIVRLPQPRRFVEDLRRRFANAHLYVSAPSQRRSLKLPGVRQRAGYPPDFVTRWTAAALRSLLVHSGYEAEGATVTPMLTRLTPRGRFKRRLFVLAWTTLLRLGGEYEHSVVAWGRPRP